MKVCFFSTQAFELNFFNELNQFHKHEITYLSYHLNADSINAVPKTEVACCFVNDKVDKPVIDGLKKRGVKLIALRSAGYNHVDYSYAMAQGLSVCRVPAYSPHAVAEHTVALILSLNRKIHRAHNRVREGDFSLNGLMGFNLYQKTVGIIGTGQIGSVLASIMRGFGCKILAYDPRPNEFCISLGVTYLALEELLSHADIVSLNCPLNQETSHLINADTLALMKDGAMLINTGRGGLIETKAVIAALKMRKLGYLGIDVYEEEEGLFFEDYSNDIIKDDVFCRLQTFPNVLITAHQAFFTQEAVHNIARVTLENITHFFKGLEPVYLLEDGN